MRILILGATGFIGYQIFLSLVAEHDVIVATRSDFGSYKNCKHIDFSVKNNWEEILVDVEIVINTIGIIEGDFHQIQTVEPIRLYKACKEKHISIIHISAIGADEKEPITDFLKTKKITDDYLSMNNNNQAKIIYPGIVLGAEGKSAQFLAEISKLPVVPLLKMADLPFVHINDLIGLVINIINNFDSFPKKIYAFSKIEPLKKVLESIKGESIQVFYLPKFMFSLFFFLFSDASIGIFNKSLFEISQKDLVKEQEPRFPKVSKRVNANEIPRSNSIFKNVVLLVLAFVWIWSGVSSLVSWDISIQLMKEINVGKSLSIIAIWTASLIDIILGFAVLSKKLRVQVIYIQFITMFVYMLILSIFVSSYWLHPFGVLSKNFSLFLLGYYLLKE